MRRGSVRAILGVLAVLLAAWGAARLLGGRDGRVRAQGLDIGAAVDAGTSVVRVLRPGGDTLRLERGDGGWRVNGWPADTAEANGLLAALDTARAADVVARSEANHERLGVTDSAPRVEIGPPGEPAVVFLVGGEGRGGRFVRRPGAPEVYLLPGPAGARLLRGAGDLRDRMIVSVDTAVVREISIRRGDRRVVVTRPDSVWRVDGTTADTAAVRDLLGGLARVSALRFPPDSAVLAADFDAPDAALEAYARAGAADDGDTPLAALLFVREGAGGAGTDYLVRRADRPEAYVVAGWTAERLLPEAEDLAP